MQATGQQQLQARLLPINDVQRKEMYLTPELKIPYSIESNKIQTSTTSQSRLANMVNTKTSQELITNTVYSVMKHSTLLPLNEADHHNTATTMITACAPTTLNTATTTTNSMHPQPSISPPGQLVTRKQDVQYHDHDH